MTESAGPIEHVRSDALPPITPAQAAAFQDACAAAAAIHSARELGVIARISEAPAVLYALGLVLLRTSSGRIYPYSTFRRWLGQAGFEAPRHRDLPGPFPFTLITAIRR